MVHVILKCFVQPRPCPVCLSQRIPNLDKDIVQCVETTDRAAVDYMLAEMGDTIDVIIPRGGGLVGFIIRGCGRRGCW